MREELSKLKKIYDDGGNIIQYLKSISGKNRITNLDIAISYDLQAGTYIKKACENPEYENERASVYGEYINQLGKFRNIVEAGVGEATTLGNLLPRLKREIKSLGFDISFSRLMYAYFYLKRIKLNDTQLYLGDLFNTPFQDNSIDVVYTNHTLEPHGNLEVQALKELYRITKKYLVLFEPIYELAGARSKKYMDEHGYVRNLYSFSAELGFNIIEYKLIFNENPYSPNNTGVIIIKKPEGLAKNDNDVINIACPVTKKPMIKKYNSYYSQESMLLYPIINNIPCLLPDNAIIATHYLDEFENLSI